MLMLLGGTQTNGTKSPNEFVDVIRDDEKVCEHHQKTRQSFSAALTGLLFNNTPVLCGGLNYNFSPNLHCYVVSELAVFATTSLLKG